MHGWVKGLEVAEQEGDEGSGRDSKEGVLNPNQEDKRKLERLVARIRLFVQRCICTFNLRSTTLTQPMPPSNNVEEFRSVLHTAKNILVLSGAGLSAASGVPTFRGNGGMWRKYDAASLATPQAFAENQSRVWQFCHYRRERSV